MRGLCLFSFSLLFLAPWGIAAPTSTPVAAERIRFERRLVDDAVDRCQYYESLLGDLDLKEAERQELSKQIQQSKGRLLVVADKLYAGREMPARKEILDAAFESDSVDRQWERTLGQDRLRQLKDSPLAGHRWYLAQARRGVTRLGLPAEQSKAMLVALEQADAAAGKLPMAASSLTKELQDEIIKSRQSLRDQLIAPLSASQRDQLYDYAPVLREKL